jgi:hypothetical protein
MKKLVLTGFVLASLVACTLKTISEAVPQKTEALDNLTETGYADLFKKKNTIK